MAADEPTLWYLLQLLFPQVYCLVIFPWSTNWNLVSQLPLTMVSNETNISITSVGVSSLHIRAPERLVFGSDKIETWKLFRKRWTNYALLTEHNPKKYILPCLRIVLLMVPWKFTKACNLQQTSMNGLFRKSYIPSRDIQLESQPRYTNDMSFVKGNKTRTSHLTFFFSVLFEFCQKRATFVTIIGNSLMREQIVTNAKVSAFWLGKQKTC